MDQIPGAAFSLVHDGEIVYEGACGFRDFGKEMEEGSVFRIASISKIISSLCLLKLREEGNLKLDDKISEYLDVSQALGDVRLRHLLSHISGSVRDGRAADWSNASFAKRDELLKYLEDIDTANRPIEDWKYSNIGFGALGLVIEEVSGYKYEEYVQEEVIDTLELDSTSFKYSEESVAGFGRLNPDQGREKVDKINAKGLNSATGIRSNIYDLSSIITEICENKEILGETSYREMMRPEWNLESGGYGLGIRIEEIDNDKFYGHSGGFFGCTTILSFNSDGFGVILLTNASMVDVHSKRNQIIKLKNKIEESEEAEAGEQDLEKFTGRFSSRWGELDIRNIGDKLFLYNPKKPVRSYHHLKRNGEKFKVKGGSGHGYKDESLEYDLTKSGEEILIGKQRYSKVKEDKFKSKELEWLQN